MVNEREIILDILLEVSKGEYLNLILKNVLDKYAYLNSQSRAFIKYVCTGVTQRRLTLDYIIDSKSKVKVSKMKPLIRELLRMSVYQIKFMNSIPSSAAINEAVKLAKKRKFFNLSGFVNGVLRNVDRDDSFELEEIEDIGIRYSAPGWIVDSFVGWYGRAVAEKMLAAGLEKSPLTARVCVDKISAKELKNCLETQGITVTMNSAIPNALYLENVNSLMDIEEFRKGFFTIQDVSSQLTGLVAGNALLRKLTNSVDAEKVFVVDLCSAPGGKAGHVAEILGERGRIQARDVSENKILKIQENLQRLNRKNVDTCVGDATVFDSSLEGKCDLVIADVPCSGLGVLSRKSDLKYRVLENDLQELKVLQRKILDNAVRYLKKGGLLLYSTCTVNPGENIEQFRYLKETHGLLAVDIKADIPEIFWGNDEKNSANGFIEEGCVQLLQGLNPCDGFFISLLRRE